MILAAFRRDPKVVFLNQFQTPAILQSQFPKVAAKDFTDAYLDSFIGDQPILITIANHEKFIARRLKPGEQISDLIPISSVTENLNTILLQIIKENKKFLITRGQDHFYLMPIGPSLEEPMKLFSFGISVEDLAIRWKNIIARLEFGGDELELTYRNKVIGKVKLQKLSELPSEIEEVNYHFLKSKTAQIFVKEKKSVFVKISDDLAIVTSPNK